MQQATAASDHSMSKYLRASLGADFGYTPGEQPADSGGWLKLNSNECRCRRRRRWPARLPLRRPTWRAIRARWRSRCERARRLHGSSRSRCSSPTAPTRCSIAAFEHTPRRGMQWCGRSPAIRCSRCSPRSSRSAMAVALEARRRAAGGVRAPPGRRARRRESEFANRALDSAGGTREQLRDAQGVVVIDEAYCDFAPASCVPLLAAHPNWLVVRTLSKSHALAGLARRIRVGDASLIDDLNAVRDSYPLIAVRSRARSRPSRIERIIV